MKKNKGLTLVELIVVIAILAVLMALLIPQYIQYVDRSRTAVCLNNLSELSHSYGIAKIPQTTQYAAALKTDLATNGGKNIEVKNSTVTCTGLCPTDGKYTFTLDVEGDITAMSCSEHGSADMSEVTAGQAFYNLLNNFNNLSVKPNTKVDGVNKGDESTYAYALYNSLTASQQAALDKYSWSIVKARGNWRLYLTETVYSDTQSADNILVYKYDSTTNKYQCTKTGKVTNGNVTSSGTKWGDWCDTMEEAKEKAA